MRRCARFVPLTGAIRLRGSEYVMLNTPGFQRLGRIRQLGLANIVFPGANHTRLEHSLGVLTLAGRLVARLQREQPELKITDEQVHLVRAAAMCHDIGHGMFSHALERVTGVAHESMTRPMVELAVAQMQGRLPPSRERSDDDADPDPDPDSLSDSEVAVASGGGGGGGGGGGDGDGDGGDGSRIDRIVSGRRSDEDGDLARGAAWWTPERIDAIVDLINGKSDPPFLAQIISNRQCGIDVDRLDYLRRDSFHTLGQTGGIDVDRILQRALVHGGDLAWPYDDWHLLAEVFFARAALFSKIYLHPDVLVADRMVQERLMRTRTLRKIREAVRVPVRFARLTDDFVTSSVGAHLWPVLGKAVVMQDEADTIARRIEEASGRSIVVLQRRWWSEGGRMMDVPLVRSGSAGALTRIRVGASEPAEVAKET